MKAFLYVALSSSTAYSKPLPEQVKKQNTEVAVLDIDAQSDELMMHYALRLLRESDKAVVCIKTDAATAEVGKVMPLLEELFQKNVNRLVLLLGEHPRLQRIFQARPQVQFKQVEEKSVIQEVKQFLETS